MVDFREVEFVDLPKRNGRKASYDWNAAISALRANAGKWGRIREYQKRTTANSAATYLRTKYRDIEFTLRGNTIYGRAGGEAAARAVAVPARGKVGARR